MADKTTPDPIVETTPEETKQLMRVHENDILGGLLAAAEVEDDIVPIEIVRKEKVVLSFRIAPLSEEDYQRCREKNTKYVKNKQMGIRLPEQTDMVRYRSALLYWATVPEDRKTIWDNKAAWEQLGVLSGIDLIDKVLRAGEKDAILDKLDEISGYESSVVLEDTAKN